MMLLRAHRNQPPIMEALHTIDVVLEARKKVKQGIILSDSSYEKLREALK